MALFFNLYEPWCPVRSNQIETEKFETSECISTWTGWNDLIRQTPETGYEQSAGAVLETTPTRNSTLRRRLDEVGDIPAYKVSIRARAEQIQLGQHSYNHPRALFLYTDRNGKKMYDVPHIIFAFNHDKGWKEYSNILLAPPNSQGGVLLIQNLGTGGSLYVDDISISPMTTKRSAPFFMTFFTLLWTTAFTLCVIALSPWKSKYGIASLLCALTILVGVLLPGKFLDSTIRHSADTLSKITHRLSSSQQLGDASKSRPESPPPASPPGADPQKNTPPLEIDGQVLVSSIHTSGHFLLFCLLAGFSMIEWATPKKPPYRILAVLLGLSLFAAATEILQFTTPDRKAGLSDLSVDLFGILLATTQAAVLSLPRRLRQRVHSS